MILAGLSLAAGVWAAWPESTVRTIRLPYGEALPKSPLAAAPVAREESVAPSATVAEVAPPPVEEPRAQAPAAEPETGREEPGRVLAAVEPAPAATRASAAPAPAAKARATEQVDERWGPDPVPSELDGLSGYEPESPEELGAEPLPGFDLTPEPRAAG